MGRTAGGFSKETEGEGYVTRASAATNSFDIGVTQVVPRLSAGIRDFRVLIEKSISIEEVEHYRSNFGASFKMFKLVETLGFNKWFIVYPEI